MNLDKIHELVRDGYISRKGKGDLWLFNYNPRTQYEAMWTPETMMCRGLIINHKTGEVVARPFDKFFNWGEGGLYSNGWIVSVTEKLDGSLGILYRENGEEKIATRGSFDSDQALHATEILKQYTAMIPYNLTLLFEIIYPENRNVIDYQTTDDIILIGARNRFTGVYLTDRELREFAYTARFLTPRFYNFVEPEEIIAQAKLLDSSHEGWVAEMSDGTRWKFKGDQYCELHRLINGITFKKTCQAIIDDVFAGFRQRIPEEYREMVDGWAKQILYRYSDKLNDIQRVYAAMPKGSRKEFAMAAQHTPISHALFMMYDKRDLQPYILKQILEEGEDGADSSG